MTPDRFASLYKSADALARLEAFEQFQEAIRLNLFRPGLAHWEAAQLFGLTMRLAIFDALRTDDFVTFREQWAELIGQGDDSDGLAWLPAIYLGAVASPIFDAESCRKLAGTALPWL